jgi:hypothetical protein
LNELKEKAATFVVERVFSRCDERYCHEPQAVEFLNRLKKEVVKNADLFLMWKGAEGNTQMLAYLEKLFKRFKLNLIVDNSSLSGAPVIYEEFLSFRASLEPYLTPWKWGCSMRTTPA